MYPDSDYIYMYGCVQCGRMHFEGTTLYEAHAHLMDKSGYQMTSIADALTFYRVGGRVGASDPNKSPWRQNGTVGQTGGP